MHYTNAHPVKTGLNIRHEKMSVFSETFAAATIAPELEFHVSRKAREKYTFDEKLFTIRGKVIFANFYAAQLFARQINLKRDVVKDPAQAVSAAEINAVGLIHEILHFLINTYRETRNANVFREALERLEGNYTRAEVDKALEKFVDEFPPLAVYKKEITIKAYLAGSTGDRDNRQIALEEMLLLWLANQNPAFAKYSELFDDEPLRTETIYPKAMDTLQVFFDEQPLFGPPCKAMSLIQALLLPVKSSPGSLMDQLRFLRETWGEQLSAMLAIKWEMLLGEGFSGTWGPLQAFETRLLRALDFIEEETKMRFFPGPGKAETQVLEYHGAEYEPEAFSPDTDWMPRLVLIAKSTLVWLDQLSKIYQREIRTLDQVPDEELAKLGRWGFTGLWLIGVWQRSEASKTIKRWCGNPEAEASAYSLYDYRIADELGGDPAYQNLKERAWKYGVRLASDMVPNHTGIVSKWVKEHPDWFISLPYPPFPGYTYSGASLSDDPNIGIYLEDHYFDRTDAAVTFKRVDFRSGDTRYIYHGNDGTAMPWNDTAQLDYTKPEVREAVIQMILEVARRFPIIRFDAAMTLAKKHYQRLWFPQPGSGGDIPSRAQYGLTKAEFDRRMPEEFWREVVDRVAKEVPDTLLLAEAFWLMEGYFVRSLGMHRVYNSAFMNMLKNEENKKYRYTIKNTIEFEPEVLKRYVNFMNNPDEETAIRQFGDGDKYFGVCMMMATMPGLPMFGHGQVEGFHEKYGMEYRKAYYDETPSQYLIDRHEREIFPLLKKRYLFAGVEQFLLYDLYQPDGRVNENVFAYSNRHGEERTLVVFHNAYAETRGWIHTSAAYSEKVTDFPDTPDAQKRLVQKNLGDGLALPTGWSDYLIFRDSVSGLEYINNCQELWQKGMYIELGAYKYRVFLDFRFVRDTDGKYHKLWESLKGQGVTSVEEAVQEMHLQPLHTAFRQFANPETLQKLIEINDAEDTGAYALLDEVTRYYGAFLESTRQFSEIKAPTGNIAADMRRDLEALRTFTATDIAAKAPKKSENYALFLKNLATLFEDRKFAMSTLLFWIWVRHTGKLAGENNPEMHSRAFVDEWLLGRLIRRILQQYVLSPEAAERAVAIVKMLTRHADDLTVKGATKIIAHENLDKLFKSMDFRNVCRVNTFDNKLWFNKEAFELAVTWIAMGKAFHIWQEHLNAGEKAVVKKAKKLPKRFAKLAKLQRHWQKAEAASGYQVAELLADLDKKAQSKRSSDKDKKSSKTATAEKAPATPAKSSAGKKTSAATPKADAKSAKTLKPSQKDAESPAKKPGRKPAGKSSSATERPKKSD